MIKTYDFIVLGGGTGGLRLALAAARQGKYTLLIEAGKLGGTCLNNGCIPTKAMLEAAHRYHQLSELSEFGISVSKPKVDIVKLLKRVNGIVNEGQRHIKKGLVHSKLEVVQGRGVFVGRKQLQVGKEIFTAKKIVISTGAKNNKPHIEGIEKIVPLTNENILRLKSLPRSIVMVGCGYISMEFATFFNYLGVRVTMLEFCTEILGMLDEDVAHTLEHYYEERGIVIKKGVRVTKVAKRKDGKLTVYYADSHEASHGANRLSADELFVAAGRSPNTIGLHLDITKVKTDRRGAVIVDTFLETNVKGIYAMGDVIGHDMFAHAVKRETDIILHNAFHQGKKVMNFSLMPWAVFTNPVVAGIGLSEKQAQAKHIKYEVLHARFNRVGKAKIINDQRGFLKILHNPVSGRIFGASCIGPQADVIIHEIVALMNSSNPSIEVLKKAIHVHPTLSEIISVLH